MKKQLSVEFDCPRCGYRFDAATSLAGNGRPTVGDISICLVCGAPIEFRADGYHWLNADEFMSLDQEVKSRIAYAVMLVVTLLPSRVAAIPNPNSREKVLPC